MKPMHLVQAYPVYVGWMVEGICDVVRNDLACTTKNKDGLETIKKNKYNDNYRISGRFMANLLKLI